MVLLKMSIRGPGSVSIRCPACVIHLDGAVFTVTRQLHHRGARHSLARAHSWVYTHTHTHTHTHKLTLTHNHRHHISTQTYCIHVCIHIHVLQLNKHNLHTHKQNSQST